MERDVLEKSAGPSECAEVGTELGSILGAKDGVKLGSIFSAEVGTKL